jgi:hypothetical protein
LGHNISPERRISPKISRRFRRFSQMKARFAWQIVIWRINNRLPTTDYRLLLPNSLTISEDIAEECSHCSHCSSAKICVICESFFSRISLKNAHFARLGKRSRKVTRNNKYRLYISSAKISVICESLFGISLQMKYALGKRTVKKARKNTFQ